MPFLLAERAHSEVCSFDARSIGQPRPLLLKMHEELEGTRSTTVKLLTPLLGWALKVKSVGLDARNGRPSLIALSAQSSHESIWIHLMNRFRYTQLW